MKKDHYFIDVDLLEVNHELKEVCAERDHLKTINKEMLKALKAIKSFDDGNFFDDLVNQGVHPDAVNKLADCIRAAIAKAEGKE